MKHIFLFGLFPQKQLKFIEKQSIGNIQYAANNFQWSLLNGFRKFDNVDLINLPFIGSFPSTFKKIHFPKINFSDEKNQNVGLGFLNLKYIKHFIRFLSARRYLLNNYNNNELKIIYVYSLNSPFLMAALTLKKITLNTKICVFAPDLPEFMSDIKSITYKIFRKIDSFFINRNLDKIDYFVFLTEAMGVKLGINKDKYIVVEGIYNNNFSNIVPSNRYHKTILYTGTLASRYGIMNLVKAFQEIESVEYSLLICGDGDCKQQIIEATHKDQRIKYLGIIPQCDVIKLQKEVDLLVNPRTSEGEYTKYSFPSKIMEYMASRTPVLINKLPGIPDEYYNFCYTTDSETIEDLKLKIVEILELPKDERNSLGIRASQFIINNKNEDIQAKKILNFIQHGK